ncbi:MAG TPA: hypothetical protein ACFYD6_08200 [Candidatus Brocadiia bacterium]|nr:hypothetical protein [Candidatus Brocadiales bacterium]
MDSSRLLEPILYGDMFDHPLTIEEVWQFAPVKCTLDEVKTVFETDSLLKEKIVEKNGCYCFKGRDRIVDIRKMCLQRSEILWKKARFVASLIQYVPFVKAVAITGSLAMNNSRAKGDIDFFVFTEEKRLWMVFAVLGTLGRLTKGRMFCPNYYLSIGHYPLRRRDFFTAREIAQAKPLIGFSYYKDFLKLNGWVTDYLPNFNCNLNWGIEILQHRLPKTLKRVLERLLTGAVGDKLEKIFKTILKSRLHVHHEIFNSELDQETFTNAINEVELRFHGHGHRESILLEFQKRLKSIYANIQPE